MYNTDRCPCGQKINTLGNYETKCMWCRMDEQKKTLIDENKFSNVKCPMCGSFDYIESTKSEFCRDCGYEQGY